MPATVSNLRTKPITDIALAAEVFGSEPDVLMLQPARFFRPWFCVPDGCYALVTEFGKRIRHGDAQTGMITWPAGFHWDLKSFGFRKVETLVTKQSVVLDMPVKGCKTQDNVTVEINIALVFRIMGDHTYRPRPAPPCALTPLRNAHRFSALRCLSRLGAPPRAARLSNASYAPSRRCWPSQ